MSNNLLPWDYLWLSHVYDVSMKGSNITSLACNRQRNRVTLSDIIITIFRRVNCHNMTEVLSLAWDESFPAHYNGTVQLGPGL